MDVLDSSRTVQLSDGLPNRSWTGGYAGVDEVSEALVVRQELPSGTPDLCEALPAGRLCQPEPHPLWPAEPAEVLRKTEPGNLRHVRRARRAEPVRADH
jgi:hypothetical protein